MNPDPIGLEGGDSLYIFSPNSQMWIDPLGLSPIIPIGMAIAAALGRFGIKFGIKVLSKAKNIRRTKHVNNRHIDRTKYPGRCSTNPNGKSKFKKPSMRTKLEDATLTNPDKIIQQGNRLRFEKDFGREIGTNGETKLRVILDPIKKKIITSFPE